MAAPAMIGRRLAGAALLLVVGAGAVAAADLETTEPEPSITLTALAADLPPGQGGEVRLRIAIAGPGPAVAPPPRLVASIGHVEPPHRIDERTFEARFLAPAAHFPELAIIAAEQDKPGARAFVTVALPAPARPAFRTAPGGKVSVWVAGRSFGPETADASGQARVSIVVPPGVTTATVRSTDARGLSSEKTIDLRPPPFPHLLLLAPAALPAGGVVEVGLIGIDLDGQPVDESRLVLRSSHLRPHPLGAKDRVARYLVRVPPQMAAGPLRLTARLLPDPNQVAASNGEEPDDLDALATSLPIQAGPLAHLSVVPQRARLVVRGDDLYGHPVPVDNVEIFVDGRPARLEPTEEGDAVVLNQGHEAGRASHPVEVEVMLDGIYARYRVPAQAIAAAPEHPAPSAERAYGGRAAVGAALGMLWRRGPGYGLAARLDGEVTPAPAPLAHLHLGVALGYVGVRSEVEDGFDRSSVTLDQLLLLGRLRWGAPLGRRVEISGLAGAGPAVSRVHSNVAGFPIAGNHSALALEAGGEAAGPAGPGTLLVGLRYLAIPLGTLPSGDVIEGSGGGLVFDLGYRVRF